MLEVDEQIAAPKTSISGLIWNAVAINFVLVSAFLTAGMIFAVDLAKAASAAVGFSLLAWACAALVLVPVWLISLGRQVDQDTPAETLHDSWLDEEP
jgi:hypothetical protein